MQLFSDFPELTNIDPTITRSAIEIIFLETEVFFLLMMCAVPRSPAKELLQKLEEYSTQASTKNDAYSRVSAESGLSVGSLHVAASRAGLTYPSHSLK